MRKQAGWVMVSIMFFLASSIAGAVLQDDLGTVGLWHMESIYYDEADLPYTADDDSQNAGRNHDMVLFRSGLNEVPPTVVPGYTNNALLFEGGQFANCPGFWSSSYTEVKLDCMLYIEAMPTELAAATTYLFTSSVFELYLWPGTSGASSDQMIFKVYYDSSTKITVQVTVGALKNKWLHVVASYDASRNMVLTVTDTTTGMLLTASYMGTSALRPANSDITFGSTSPSVGSKPTNRNFRGMIDAVKISNRLTVEHYAYNPVPANGATIYEEPAGLAWSKGLVAQMSDVYFGTSAQAVTNAAKHSADIDGSTTVDLRDFGYAAAAWQGADGDAPCADVDMSGQVDMGDFGILAGQWLAAAAPHYIGGTAQDGIGMPGLAASTTYYWRVASSNCSETDAGNLWQFTTGGLAAFGPTPANASTNVTASANRTMLTWGAGFGAHTYYVYFGTGGNPPFYTQTSERTLESPLLAPLTSYRWRVDAVSDTGTTSGTEWQFTTGAIGAINPSPANGATDIKYPMGGVQLSWQSVFEPTSYQVYFGTTNPPAYAGSVSESTFISADVLSNTMYYWQIRCISEFGDVTGPVWQFTTSTPAFPTAEGFGRFAKGGRGGNVYHVTHPGDSGAGSLRDAVSQGDRTIVFDVGGQIVLNSRLGITKNRLTIAGQTAPGDGISIAGPGISIGADDLIMRYVRVRYTSQSTTGDDALSMNDTCDNNIVDHVSVSWGTDEVFSINRSRNVTVQWCIVSEGQNSLGHSKGSLLEGPILTWHHNLYAHNNDRNPKNKGTFDYRNNVAYDWGFAPYIAGGNTGGQCYANCIANYYIAGPSTTTPPGIMVVGGNSNYHMYFADNLIDWNKNGVLDGADLGTAMLDATALPDLVAEAYAMPPVITTSAELAYQQVLANVGCSLVRDSIDTRVISEVIAGTGGIIYSYLDVGGLGTISGGTAPTDTDQDGMPNSWETAHGLNPNDAADRNSDADGDGYTNLEEYLNSLVP